MPEVMTPRSMPTAPENAANEATAPVAAETSVRFCRKCLLRDMPEGEYFANLYQYISGIPKQEKVVDAVYEQRLSICRSCEHLLSGMCRLCGCYVELRAAMKIRACPDVPARWERCVETEIEY